MRGLVNRLNEDPEIREVYFDATGAWSVIPSNLHPEKRTRDEVLEHWENLPEEEKFPEQFNKEGEDEEDWTENEVISSLGKKIDELLIEKEELKIENESLKKELEDLKSKKSKKGE